MWNFKQKLHNSRGVSMIIALVFMLFCVFVGGSVLAAATANASRVAHRAERQEYLNQRSAAIVLQDSLKGNDRTRMKLTIYDNGQTVRFYLPAAQDLTALQRTVYECAIQTYQHSSTGGSRNVIIENFMYQGTSLNRISDFWVQPPDISGTVHIAGTYQDAGDLADFDAFFACDPAYNYDINFGDVSHLKLRMGAYVGSHTIPASAPDALNGRETIVTAISWSAPEIVKGDAA